MQPVLQNPRPAERDPGERSGSGQVDNTTILNPYQIVASYGSWSTFRERERKIERFLFHSETLPRLELGAYPYKYTPEKESERENMKEESPR